MKYVTLVGDGMGDHPLAELDGQTPLEAAHTPNIDALCRAGELFLNATIPEGYPPGSDVANLSLLGYDPRLYYTGRAPLEAASMGVDLADDETAFRCNLVTTRKDGGSVQMEDFAAGHISSEEGAKLLKSVNEALARKGIEGFSFKPGISYRNLLVVKGEHPDFKTVPPHDYIGKDVTEHWLRYMADNKWSKLLDIVATTFATHPVNEARLAVGKNPATMVWLWGEGKMPSAPKLTEKFNLTGNMVSAVDLLKGLGVVGGLDVAEVEGVTGYIDTNYEGKVEASLTALKIQDFSFVHLEGPDEAGHQGSIKDKLQAIEDFDSKVVASVVAELRARKEEFRVLITMDHFTPIDLKTHTSEPVPTIIYDSRELKKGSGQNFSEVSCRNYVLENSIPTESGYGVMARLLMQEEL
ncbi:MAG: cofactor-independent phosphoglycerate mutase [Desulfotalea sp.]